MVPHRPEYRVFVISVVLRSNSVEDITERARARRHGSEKRVWEVVLSFGVLLESSCVVLKELQYLNLNLKFFEINLFEIRPNVSSFTYQPITRRSILFNDNYNSIIKKCTTLHYTNRNRNHNSLPLWGHTFWTHSRPRGFGLADISRKHISVTGFAFPNFRFLIACWRTGTVYDGQPVLLRPHLLVGVASVHAIHDRDGVGSVKSVSIEFRSSLESCVVWKCWNILILISNFLR